MNTKKEKTALSDKELEKVTGGTGTEIERTYEGGKDKTGSNTEKGARDNMGSICPLNGNYCKHGDISCLNGSCHYARERKECTKNGDFTVFICEYINDQN